MKTDTNGHMYIANFIKFLQNFHMFSRNYYEIGHLSFLKKSGTGSCSQNRTSSCQYLKIFCSQNRTNRYRHLKNFCSQNRTNRDLKNFYEDCH